MGVALLLVEDDEPLARLLARFLGRGGYAVEVCTGAAAAEARLGEGAAYACVVADLTLEEGRTGLEVLVGALGSGQARYGLLTSGYPLEPELFPPGVRERAGILQKPFTPPELLAALAALGAGGEAV